MSIFDKTVMTVQFVCAAIVYSGAIYLFVQSILSVKRKRAKQ
jgi:hypothetical protein